MRIGPAISIPGTGGNVFSANALGGGSLKTWLRGDSNTLNAGNVSQLTDLSGQGNHATQGTGGLQPLFVASGVNSQPVARGDGVDDRMSLAGITTGTTMTVSMVVSKSSAANAYLWASNVNAGFISNFGGVSFEWFNGADRQTFSAGATGVHILTVTQQDGVNVSGYFDGNATPVFSIVATVAINTRIINTLWNTSAAGAAAGSDIAEFLVYTSVLSAGDLARLHAYLKARYAL